MKRFLALLFLVVSLPLFAQQLEVIRLQHKSAEQVLPVLQPLVEPGGTLTGHLNSLFLRASAANRAQIREALAALDVPLRRLLITVRQDNRAGGEAEGAEWSGSVGTPGVRVTRPGAPEAGGGSVEIRRGDDVLRGSAYGTRGSSGERSRQQVQTVEGGRAFIRVGSSLPLPLRQVVLGPRGAVVAESIVYVDLGSGFDAVPHLAGDQVTVEILPRQESLSATVPGGVNSTRISTTVAGRLGEWIELGGSGGEAGSGSGGGFAYSTRSGFSEQRVLLRVDEIR